MIRKTELSSTDLDKLLLDIQMQCVYIHIAESKDRWECSIHSHPYMEIGFIYSGSGNYYIGNIEYQAETGDIFVIPPGESHYEVNNPDCPFQIIFLMIKFLGDNKEWINDFIKSLQGKIHLFQEKKVKEIYDDITEEVIVQEPGYLSIIDARLKSLLILIYRKSHNYTSDMLKTSNNINLSERNKSVLEKIEKFIMENISTKLTLESIAQKFFYHPKYLSQIYKKEKGQTISDFINGLRIGKAKQMLTDFTYSIEQISEMLGYSSVQHFYKSFKGETGKTPAIYRSEYHHAPRDPFTEPVKKS